MGSTTSIALPEIPPGLPVGPGWVACPETAPVVFPYDGSVVARAPVGSVEHAKTALDAGVAAVRPVGKLGSAARRAILLDVERELSANADRFVDLLVAETGKTRADCTVELSRTLFTWTAAAVAWCDW